jgi:hypothetical protein
MMIRVTRDDDSLVVIEATAEEMLKISMAAMGAAQHEEAVVLQQKQPVLAFKLVKKED